jgi:hypothetical protein
VPLRCDAGFMFAGAMSRVACASRDGRIGSSVPQRARACAGVARVRSGPRARPAPRTYSGIAAAARAAGLHAASGQPP